VEHGKRSIPKTGFAVSLSKDERLGFFSDLVIGGIQDELGPDAVVLWTAVVKEGVGEVRHPFAAEAVPTAEEHCILGDGEQGSDTW